jgi:serine protease Do
VLSFNASPVHDEHELPALVAQTPINQKVPVEIVRNGKHMTLEVTIGERKEAQVASAKADESGGNWGIQVGDITPEIAQQFHLDSNKGVVIRRVSPDSPASDAGLQPGDVVLEVNHDKIGAVADFVAKAKEAKANRKSALLLVQRQGSTLYTVIKPGSGRG